MSSTFSLPKKFWGYLNCSGIWKFWKNGNKKISNPEICKITKASSKLHLVGYNLRFTWWNIFTGSFSGACWKVHLVEHLRVFHFSLITRKLWKLQQTLHGIFLLFVNPSNFVIYFLLLRWTFKELFGKNSIVYGFQPNFPLFPLITRKLR